MTTWLLYAAAFLSTRPMVVNPCDLLTQAEAEAILGQQIAVPAAGGSGECHYAAKDGMVDLIVYLMPLQFSSKEEFHAFVVKDTEAMNARIKKSMEKTGATVKETTVDPVPEVEAPAYYVDPSLLVLTKSGRVLNVVADGRAQAVAVAGKALGRAQ
jgi:hypothetical protein